MIANDVVMIPLSAQHCARTCFNPLNPTLGINIKDTTETIRESWKIFEDKGKRALTAI